MISGAVVGEALRLAGLVEWLDEADWSADLTRLTGPRGARSAAMPTYGEVARAGTDLVASLSGAGRWADAVGQARHLRRFFIAAGMELGPIAAQAFDGLLAAALARDPDELNDFRELVAEMFP